MPALLFNLSTAEIFLIGVIALLLFGKRLPEVAAQVAVQVQRARRALQDLRRETGIDREMWEMRRRFEEAVPRDIKTPSQAIRDAKDAAGKQFREALTSAALGASEPKPSKKAKQASLKDETASEKSSEQPAQPKAEAPADATPPREAADPVKPGDPADPGRG